jgi:hypothetical protein
MNRFVISALCIALALTASADRVIAAWPASRIENSAIYLQNINPDGSLGALDEPSIAITSPSAPNDTAHVGSTLNIHFTVGDFILAEQGGDGSVKFSLNGSFSNYLFNTQAIMLALVQQGVHELRLELVNNNQEPLSPPVFDIVWVDNRIESANRAGGAVTDFALHAAYPNPFNATTEIRFDLPRNGHAIIRVYDIAGRLVTTLLNRRLEQGRHHVAFEGSAFASGIYLYRLSMDDQAQARKLILVK